MISKPLADAAMRDVVLYAARFRALALGSRRRRLREPAGEIVCTTGVAGQLSIAVFGAG